MLSPPPSPSPPSCVSSSCGVGEPQVSKHEMFFVNVALSRQYVSLTICNMYVTYCDMMTGYDFDLYSHTFGRKERQHNSIDEMTCGTAKGAHSSCTKIQFVMFISRLVGCCVGNPCWCYLRRHLRLLHLVFH